MKRVFTILKDTLIKFYSKFPEKFSGHCIVVCLYMLFVDTSTLLVSYLYHHQVTMYAANTTLQLASTVIFLISMCQIGMYVVANCDRCVLYMCGWVKWMWMHVLTFVCLTNKIFGISFLFIVCILCTIPVLYMFRRISPM